MNAYVAGGWGATAVMLALYAARTLYRGRALSRVLSNDALSPTEPAEQAGETVAADAPPAQSEEARAWP